MILGKQKLLYSGQAELESAYKTIRMAENYGVFFQGYRRPNPNRERAVQSIQAEPPTDRQNHYQY
jgi:hypothetical protein